MRAIDRLRLTRSWQRQRERRTLTRPSAEVDNIGRDTVERLGFAVSAQTRSAQLTKWLDGELRDGLDTYYDRIASAAWIGFADVGSVQKRSRGQYLDASTYVYGGAFTEAVISPHDRMSVRVGGRLSWVAARAPADPDSGSSAVDKTW